MEDHGYAYSVLEKLSFNRVAGTEDEKKAAQLLLSEIEQAGGKGELMEFPIPASTVTQEGMRIVSPYAREVETIGYGRSGSLPEGGKTLKFYYAERGVAEDYVGMDDLSDTAVISRIRPNARCASSGVARRRAASSEARPISSATKR